MVIEKDIDANSVPDRIDINDQKSDVLIEDRKSAEIAVKHNEVGADAFSCSLLNPLSEV